MTLERDDDRELDQLFALARGQARAPQGFADRVLAQVALRPRVAPVAVPAPEPAFAFWLRAIGQPGVALACVLAGLVAMWPQVLAAAGATLARESDGVLARTWTVFADRLVVQMPALRDPIVSGVVLLAIAAPLLFLAWDAAHRAERWTVRLAGPAV